MRNLLIYIANLQLSNQHLNMNTTQSTRYIRPENYARSYLTDRQILLWNHRRSNTWATATYNRETDTFTGIYSWGEADVNVSLHQIGINMARNIGRASCNVWAEFKTLNGNSVERLDL